MYPPVAALQAGNRGISFAYGAERAADHKQAGNQLARDTKN